MSWSLLERFFQSELFNNDPSLAVAYLARYPSHVGIQYVLCHKLRHFAYEEIEFFLPQLCHLLVSVDNESMALEEFLIDLCQESVSAALLTFWLFQTHLHDLSTNPQSAHFRVCRRIFNKVQHIVFGASSNPRIGKINDNILPTCVLASIVMAGVAAPFLPRDLGPLAIAQARKPRLMDETISEALPVQSNKSRVTRSHTISGGSSKANTSSTKPPHSRTTSEVPELPDPRVRSSRQSERRHPRRNNEPRPVSAAIDSYGSANSSPTPRFSTSSLPDIVRKRSPQPPMDIAAPPNSQLLRAQKEDSRRYSAMPKATGLDSMKRSTKVHMLRSNYFRNETQFLSALEGISTRLVIVPKQARLSALRAELALVARDLPAEVDIPSILPATLDDGSPSRSKHHRIVRINPAEATSLNSAERVPYLLMVEVLRDDFDFDPESEANQRLLASLMSEAGPGGNSKRRLFDITPAIRAAVEGDAHNAPDSEFEPFTGDLSSPTLLRALADNPSSRVLTENENPQLRDHTSRLSSGTHTTSSISIPTPRSSDVHNSRSNSPGPKKLVLNTTIRPPPQTQDQQDISALATHMRTAAQMLTQLDMSGSKRPRQEVEAIKGKIIASMQSLEEQNFNGGATIAPPATFDTIMANVRSEQTPVSDGPDDFYDSDEQFPEPGSRGAGAARMENDQLLAGVRRQGDRDDPSAATFGEEWKSKRDRIRRSSPYGWMKNWDLLSVIVKTGSDLRQEMFACQLIRICSKIWEDANVPVWVRQMKILVTGESSGLIETITNGVSLHSLKRSLTLAGIASGANPRKRIATLKDHFVKTFGEVDTPSYKAASEAFMRSLAAYSLLCYILQLKDRHNGNILIDNAGHIIHIDFGFMLSNSPGSVGFEAAPFKLTQEYVDVLGGPTGADFENFKTLCKEAFQALRKSAENIVSVVEMMGKESKMACFASGGTVYVTNALRQRFCLQLSKQEAEGFVEDLIAKALGSYYTRLYDNYQYRMQGIY